MLSVAAQARKKSPQHAQHPLSYNVFCKIVALVFPQWQRFAECDERQKRENLHNETMLDTMYVSIHVSRSIKMNHEKVTQILRILAIFDALNQSRGEYRLGQIVDWSTMSRATCDRYLRKMTDCEIVKMTDGVYGGKYCRLFSIAEAGEQLIRVYSI